MTVEKHPTGCSFFVRFIIVMKMIRTAKPPQRTTGGAALG
ncbi:hypothetical protein B4113_3548 [Geobacillus sp. B4113_201601]|nr:hypothetical protein B4113_3548 [Geobacillus sp. B4113_201601]